MSKPMTNYNERLDKIFKGIDKSIQARIMREPLSDESYIVDMRLKLADAVSAEAKQAITSLIKELVAEAKPKTMPSNLSPENYERCERVVNQYHQNLLKGLEKL